MKKTGSNIGIILFLICFLSGSVSAALVAKDEYVIDFNAGTNGQVWLRNMDLFTGLTAYEQILSVARYSQIPEDTQIATWHIATESDFNNLMQNSAEEVYSVFIGADLFSSAAPYYRSVLSGRILPESGYTHYDAGIYRSESKYDPSDPVRYSFFQVANGRINFTVGIPTLDGNYAAGNYGAWVVADIIATAVPVPASVLLLGSGIFAFSIRKILFP